MGAGGLGPATPGDDDQRQGEQEWPDQVELLLHSQGPEVLQRRGLATLVEVVGAEPGEVHVRGEQRRPRRIHPQLLDAHQRQVRCGVDGRGEDDQRRGRQDPARPAGIELADANTAGRRGLTHEQLGDEVSGDHEEDVNADKASGEPAGASMGTDDEQHRDGAKPLDVTALPRCRPVGGVPACRRVASCRRCGVHGP